MYDSVSGLNSNSACWSSSLPPTSEVSIDLGPVAFFGHRARLAGQLLCTPSLPPHGEAHALQAANEAWGERMGLWQDSEMDHLRELSFCWLWTDALADAPFEKATILPDYCAMFTILDDAAERYIGANQGDAFVHVAKVFRVFQSLLSGELTSPPPIPHRKYEETCAALLDLRRRITEFVGPHDYTRFLQGMDSYFRGVLQQVYLSEEDLPLSRETQIYNRTTSVAFRPTIVLVAALKGIHLSDAVLAHPLFLRTQIAICRLGGVINDIISFPKETLQGNQLAQYHNLIAAEYNELLRDREEGNLLEKAILRAFRFHNNEMFDYLELGSVIGKRHPEFRDYLAIGADAHRSWMDWCLRVQRYTAAFASPVAISAFPTPAESFGLRRTS